MLISGYAPHLPFAGYTRDWQPNVERLPMPKPMGGPIRSAPSRYVINNGVSTKIWQGSHRGQRGTNITERCSLCRRNVVTAGARYCAEHEQQENENG